MSKHPVFVVEGPDGSGKTTLCQELVRQTGARYYHLTYRFKDRMNLYHAAALELALRWSDERPVILDRWWPSEIIYADVYRGGSRWRSWSRFLDRVTTHHGFTYVFCIPSDEEKYSARYRDLQASRTEMYEHSMEKVRRKYVEMFSRRGSRDDWVLYDLDTDGNNLPAFCEMLRNTSWQIRYRVLTRMSDQ